MSEREFDALIEAQPELASLPASLRASAGHISARPGQTIFRTGARPARMFYVLDGEVRLLRRSRNGADIVLQRVFTGFAAEASLDSQAYHCDAVAAAPSPLLAFPVDRFRKALAEDDRFRTFWMGRLARELRSLRSRCERLSLNSAADRIEHYIEAEGKDGKLELRRTRKAWAAELGLTHEALYRALAALQRSGQMSLVERKGSLLLTMKRVPESATRTRPLLVSV